MIGNNNHFCCKDQNINEIQAGEKKGENKSIL